jgi:uncharacterized protein (TIGR00297 family)
MPTSLLIAFGLAACVSLVAYLARSLTLSGACAATALGTIVLGLGGWNWAILLLAFFISSSALTRAFGQTKRKASEKYAKGGQRDAAQVVSNGGVAALFVLGHTFLPESLWPWVGYAGALAAVNADTWATELGVLDARLPRLITSLRVEAERGTSGAISAAGTAASLLAAALIAVLAGAAGWQLRWPLLVAVSIAGLAGSIADSLLGATLQAIYFCPLDQKETEKHPFHTCGARTIQIRGLNWLSNDLVNVACSATGAAVALLLAALLGVG